MVLSTRFVLDEWTRILVDPRVQTKGFPGIRVPEDDTTPRVRTRWWVGLVRFDSVESTRSGHSSQGSPQLASTAARSWPSTEPSRLVSAGQDVAHSASVQATSSPA